MRPLPQLAEKLAKKVVPEDFVKVLRCMINKDITTDVNRMKSYLCAAFNYVLRSQNDPRQRYGHTKHFDLKTNPVD
ncbi:hypothetical protein [Abyssogena phaseoliformis symbiont]|uniref:hypothetical protein n=1 Tax=Abyssogena phaseoliformis symbiont TaxID=596095 RepID=UPI0019158941|nr:hypothetical protein [Abyssogena phaseoliformis symbiont]